MSQFEQPLERAHVQPTEPQGGVPSVTRHWVTSDSHFGHEGIIDLDAFGHRIRRPFKDAAEMDRQLIARWNARVGPDDTIFHLGDIAWGLDALMRVGARLSGRKKLMLGNHDTLDADVYREAGFEVVNGNYSYRTTRGEWVMLSHAPVHESCLVRPGLTILGNIHGHIHEREEPTPMHLNVSVERTGYEPMRLDHAIDILRRRRLDEQQ